MLAIYNEKDELLNLFDSINMFAKKYNLNSLTLRSEISKHKNLLDPILICKFNIFLIDVETVHKDIFKNEDLIFKEEFKEEFLNNADKIKELNISERTFYRHKKIDKLKSEGIFYNEL
jgi:hypothetical protein